MQWVVRAATAAAVLGCALSAAQADDESHWLTDSKSNCAVFDANAQPGDGVAWSGGCADGKASGAGTATFSNADGVFESFTGTFADGAAQDGHVVVHWGKGWTYDGNDMNGQFNGQGTLTNDKGDRFEGNWVDGKMNGHGSVRRADGEYYEGDWKDDLPSGAGRLKRPDGSVVEGTFADGKLIEAKAVAAEPPAKAASPAPADAAATMPRGLESLSGKTLSGIDGSQIALTPIEGGIERKITPAGGAAQKTTFTFMNDRLGTVVEDGGPADGANVTGFFRLTDTGVEVRYADGRSEMLTAGADGGVQLTQTSAGGETVCHAWYPDGHVFSEDEKKAALAAYASKLGLAAPGGAPKPACGSAKAVAPVASNVRPPASRRAEPKPVASHTAFHPPAAHAPTQLAALDTVAVRDSVVHPIDAPAPPVIAGPVVSSVPPGEQDGAHCLSVESDGHEWGFRNACDFPVQFAYCLMHSDQKLTDCGSGPANSVGGSVAAKGFGALSADNSLSEKDADHDFRWVACAGGAGEVAAHLDRADPPSGRCDRAQTADNH